MGDNEEIFWMSRQYLSSPVFSGVKPISFIVEIKNRRYGKTDIKINPSLDRILFYAAYKL